MALGAHLDQVDPEESVFAGHGRQFALGPEPARIRSEFVAVHVVQVNQTAPVTTPGARLAGGNTVVASRPQQMRVRVQLIAGAGGGQYQGSQGVAPLKCVIDHAPGSGRIIDLLGFPQLGALHPRPTR